VNRRDARTMMKYALKLVRKQRRMPQCSRVDCAEASDRQPVQNIAQHTAMCSVRQRQTSFSSYFRSAIKTASLDVSASRFGDCQRFLVIAPGTSAG